MNAAPIDAAPAYDAAATNFTRLEMLLRSKEKAIQEQIAARQIDIFPVPPPAEIPALRIELEALENEIQVEKDRIIAARALDNRGMAF